MSLFEHLQDEFAQMKWSEVKKQYHEQKRKRRLPKQSKTARDKCASCRNLERACAAHFYLNRTQPDRQQRSSSVRLYDDWSALYRSAQRGCHLCRCWVIALLDECPSSSRRRMLQKSDTPVIATSPITVLSPLRSDLSETRGAHFFTVSCGVEATLRLGGVTDKEFEALWNRHEQHGAASWIKERLRCCHETHESCNELKVSGKLPTRLLRIDDPSLVKLVDGQEALGSSYVALSYCWGDGHEPKLTRNIEPDLRVGVAKEFLALTVQHAVEVCQQVDVSFLWVDALCIRQDLEEASEWNAEAASMQHIYGNAYFTLSVCSSDSASDGFKFPHTSVEHEMAIEPEVSMLCDMLPVPMRKGLAHIKIESPPASRGWVFQEEQLSPRILYWSHHGLFWSCSMQIDAENGTVATGKDNLFPQHTIPKMLDPHEFKKTHDPITLWDDMISAYSTRDFTRASDRLPAVSGLATLIAETTGEDYTYGLWTSRLPGQLLWIVSAPLEHMAQEPSAGLPSWSWASIAPARKIIMPKQASTRARFVKSAVQDDRTVLHLSGRLRKLTSGLNQLDHWPEELQQDAVRIVDLKNKPAVWAINEEKSLILASLAWNRPILIYLDHPISGPIEELVCFEISYIGLLLLQPVTGTTMYRRVGCAQSHREPALFDGLDAVEVMLV